VLNNIFVRTVVLRNFFVCASKLFPEASAEAEMGVVHIEDEAGLQRELSKVPDRLVLIDFTATWCGPCKMMSPIFEELSGKYRGVGFLKVDVDECPDIAGKYNVQAMPTFIFFKHGKEIDRMRGADTAGLEAKVKTHGGSNASQSSGFTGTGQRLGLNTDSSTADGAAAGATGGGGGIGGWIGSWLGSGNSSQNEATNANSADIEESAKFVLKTDPKLPTTKVQVRLVDGTKLTVQVNLTTPVSSIREYICLVRPDHAGKEFSLNSTASFPVKEITDETISIDDAGLANSVLVQKPKV